MPTRVSISSWPTYPMQARPRSSKVVSGAALSAAGTTGCFSRVPRFTVALTRSVPSPGPWSALVRLAPGDEATSAPGRANPECGTGGASEMTAATLPNDDTTVLGPAAASDVVFKGEKGPAPVESPLVLRSVPSDLRKGTAAVKGKVPKDRTGAFNAGLKRPPPTSCLASPLELRATPAPPPADAPKALNVDLSAM